MAKPVKDIKNAAAEAIKTIANAANEAAKVVANAAAEAVKVSNAQHSGGAADHDLLVELKTRMEDLKNDIKELKDGTAAKIENHEIRIASIDKWKSSISEQEGLLSNIPKNCKRITDLETSKTRQNVMMSIGIGLLTILVGIITYHIFQV